MGVATVWGVAVDMVLQIIGRRVLQIVGCCRS